MQSNGLVEIKFNNANSKYGVNPEKLLIEIAENDNVYLLIGNDNEYNLINTFPNEHIGEEMVFNQVTTLENGWKIYDVNKE